jgi:hypothetical protein
MRAATIASASSARWLHASPIASKTMISKVVEAADKVCIQLRSYPVKP